MIQTQNTDNRVELEVKGFNTDQEVETREKRITLETAALFC